MATVPTLLDARFSQMREASAAQAVWPTGKQRDAADRSTNFVYSCESLDELRRQAQFEGCDANLLAYAEKRWVNRVRHDAWLELLLASPDCARWANPRDPKCDLLAFGTPFDLKVTRYPRTCRPGLGKRELARWYYENQSRGSRFYVNNRLFVCAKEETHLYDIQRAEVSVAGFLANFVAEVFSLSFNDERLSCAVITV